MKNSLFICFLFSMFLLSLGSVNGLESLGTFKQNECVRVTQICSDATYINISSISYPNSSLIVSNIEMTSAGSGEYYYIDCNTSQLGRYDVRGVSDGCEKTFTFYYDVTKTGVNMSIAETDISTTTIYFLLGLGVIFLTMGLFILGKGFWITWLGIFFIIFGFIFLYYDLSLVNLYVNTITISGSSAEGVFLMFARFIKLLPYITWLIVGFAIIKLLSNIKKEKSSSDGWDNNKY